MYEFHICILLVVKLWHCFDNPLPCPTLHCTAASLCVWYSYGHHTYTSSPANKVNMVNGDMVRKGGMA